jgi:hypothetical protein
MDYTGPERRSGTNRRSGSPERRERADLARTGTDSEMRGSVIDRREDGSRRSTDRITIDELERMR